MPNVEVLKKESYLAAVKNSVGSKAYRTLVARVNGKKTDILENGELSCAFFVSTILHNFDLIEKIHATVKSTVVDLEKKGWKPKNKPAHGDVLVWESVIYPDGQQHTHIGFYIGSGKAISNSSKKKMPAIHELTFGKAGTKNYRKITHIFGLPL